MDVFSQDIHKLHNNKHTMAITFIVLVICITVCCVVPKGYTVEPHNAYSLKWGGTFFLKKKGLIVLFVGPQDVFNNLI